MGKLKITNINGGDDRSQAYVDVQLESGEFLAKAVILQEEIRLYFIQRGKEVVWSNFGCDMMPIEKTWVGKKFPDCEFRELKDEEWFKDIVIAALDDTPAIFPVDTYPYPDWEEDMEGYPKEYDIQDFNPEDFEKVEK
jgi:hypothetical protein